MIEAVYHPEGRVYNTNVMTINPSVVWRYEYSIRDHASASLSTGLGNTRITLRLCSAQAFSDLNGTCPERSRRDNKADVSSSATTNEVLQENHYYPGVYPERSRRGLGTNGAWMNSATSLDNLYQYNGKELNADWGLNMLDYGARMYMADVGRWGGVDAMASDYAGWSPYNYVMGNPVRLVDPDGMRVDDYYFNQFGQMVAHVETEQPDRVFVQTNGEQKDVKTTATGTDAQEVASSGNFEEIGMNSDLGYMIRAVYAEMSGQDFNSMLLTAESIHNRTELPSENYDHADSYKDAVMTSYDVSRAKDNPKRSPDASERFNQPLESANSNPIEKASFLQAVGTSIKAHHPQVNEKIGNGIIFYHSESPTFRDNNPKLTKIDISALKPSGIKGAWKYKD